MEENIKYYLDELGYENLSYGLIEEAKKNIISLKFINTISFLSKKLSKVCSLDEFVNEIENVDNISNFSLELSSFLREIGCPYDSLIEGSLNLRLKDVEQRLLLLDYLLSELLAANLSKGQKSDFDKLIILPETDVAANLSSICSTLNISLSTTVPSTQELFSLITNKLYEILCSVPAELLSKPILKASLTDKQWDVVAKLQQEMDHEYSLRKKVLLKRLEVTVESFKWSPRTKHFEKEINEVYSSFKPKLVLQPKVILSDVLACREDIAIMQKISSFSTKDRSNSSVYKIKIGRVPDRGGRVAESEPPPPEMPSWQKRTSNVSRGGRMNWNQGDRHQSFNDNKHGAVREGRGGHWGQNPYFSSSGTSYKGLQFSRGSQNRQY